MSDTGWKSPASVITLEDTLFRWQHPENAQSVDGVNTTFFSSLSRDPQDLQATQFGFNVPSNATITLIEGRMLEGSASRVNCFTQASLLIGGATDMGAFTTIQEYPNVSNNPLVYTWSGSFPSIAQINDNAGFGFQESTTVIGSTNANLSFDGFQMRISYTTAVGSTRRVFAIN